MNEITVKINEKEIKAQSGTTILDCAREAGVSIPTLCHLNLHETGMVNQAATCRVCMVEVEGRRNLAPACNTLVTDKMVVKTNSMKAIQARRLSLELLMSNHPKDCLVCDRNLNCELQKIAGSLGISEIEYKGKQWDFKKDESSLSLVRDPNKCILCRRCETMCNTIQTVGVYSTINRGFNTIMSTAFEEEMAKTSCTFCGQCTTVCPTGALTQKDNVRDVWNAINDPESFVIVQTAPAIRVTLGEEFDLPKGTRVTGKMVAALRRIGFEKVYDTDFGADLTIMEEAKELVYRMENGKTLPMVTSCCPAWIRFVEHHFPELLEIPSTCKSPHEMFGTIAKTYLAEKLGISPEKMVVVSIMPCIAKKYEAARPELANESYANVDFTLSTRELGKMIREAGIAFSDLPEEDFDDVMGESSGAGVIFGTTGGVIEAAVRTAYTWITGEKPKEVEFTNLRGLEGIREATYRMNGQDFNIAVAHGLGNARRLLEEIRDNKSNYHAIEIMACPGGCIGGGGQPFHRNDPEILRKRSEAIYEEDRRKEIRYSHENKELQKLYEEFLGEPFGEKAHELLHTHYTKNGL